MLAQYGDDISKVAAGAVHLAQNLSNTIVAFEFNDVLCMVDKDTSPEHLVRDYHMAHTMDWTTIGPKYAINHPWYIVKEHNRREKKALEQSKREAKEREANERKERDSVLEDIENEKILLTPGLESEWQKMKAGAQKDHMYRKIVDFAETWARLMQVKMAQSHVMRLNPDKAISTYADKTMRRLGYFGMSGSTYGEAVSILVKFWKHGELLRKWHNNSYGHDGPGIVDPCVVTIDTKYDE